MRFATIALWGSSNRAWRQAALVALAATFAPPVSANDDLFRFGQQVIQGIVATQPRRQPAPPFQSPAPRSENSRPPLVRTQRAIPVFSRADVQEAQRRLNGFGYDAGPADGMMGPRTRTAIRAFQSDRGLAATGAPDAVTLRALARPDPVAAPAPAETVPTVRAATSGPESGGGSAGIRGPVAAFVRLEGFDLPLGDYRAGFDDPALLGGDATGCEAACVADVRCRAFTYNQTAAVCILKDAVTAPSPYPGATSGIKTAPGNENSAATSADVPAGDLPVGGAPVVSSVSAEGTASLPSGAPQWRGRMVVPGAPRPKMGDGYYWGSEIFVRMAALLALRDQPGVMEDDETAAKFFDMLDETERVAIADTARVPRKAVLSARGLSLRELDEFERPRLLAAIRERTRALLLAEAPKGPVPVLILCGLGFGDYDFQQEIFPVLQGQSADYCGAITSPQGININTAGLSLRAPVPTERLPDALPVPRARAEAYKNEHFALPDGADSRWMSSQDANALGLEAILTGVRRGDRAFEIQVQLEGIKLFRTDRMDAPFAEPPLAPIASLATVSAEPRGRVALDAEFVALNLLKANPDALAAEDFAAWARLRAGQELGGRGSSWANFFHPDIGGPIARGHSEPSPDLVERFAEWIRARAQAIPPAAELHAGGIWQDARTEIAKSGDARVFRTNSRAQAYAKRLGVSEDRIAIPREWHNGCSGFLPGFGTVEELVVVLPVSRDRYAVPLILRGDEKQLETYVTLRIDALRIQEVQDGAPIVVLEATPLAARIVKAGETLTETEFDPALRAPEPAAESGSFDAETADLLRLRHLPDTVDDLVMKRMMLSRFAYEARAPEPVIGGRFFADVSARPKPAEFEAMLPDFRAWMTARAVALPERLTLSLDLLQGVAPYESWGAQHGRVASCRGTGKEGTEKAVMTRRVCDYLAAAWETPDDVLFLRNNRKDYIAEGESRGPRTRCGADLYCRAIQGAQREVGLPAEKGVRDLVRVDRLPQLDRAALAETGRSLRLEIDIEPTRSELATVWPESAWTQALLRVQSVIDAYSLDMGSFQPPTLPGQTFLHSARALAARVVDAKTGEVVAEPALAPIPRPPEDLLETPEANAEAEKWDVLGIRLGMTFAEAEALIREHMPVDRVMVADPKALMESVAGPPPPFSSGRMYVSEERREAIAIFDEPPAAEGAVLGLWRLVKLPKGALDPVSLSATLRERYGEPAAVEASANRAEFLWSRFNPDCGGISSTHQSELWRDVDGAPAVPPAFTKNQHYYPDLWVSIYGLIADDGTRQEVGSLCPAILGVERQTWSAVAAAEDELVTWLYDERAYAEAYYASREAEAEAEAPATPATLGVKF